MGHMSDARATDEPGFHADELRLEHLGGRVDAALCLAFLVALGLTAYHWILHLSLTGIDTATLLDANRFDQAGGPFNVFAHEIRRGVQPWVGFYRPWTGLHYGFDYMIFGLRPLGYHIESLALHIASAWLLFVVTRRLGAGFVGATLAALWFVMHPLGVEIVPAVSRRADLWVVLNLLLACYGLLRWQAGERGGRWLMLLCGVLAPLSKETGLALPFILAAVARPGTLRRVFVTALLLLLPAVLGRFLALRGAGGYDGFTLWLTQLPRGFVDLVDLARVASKWGARVLALLILGWAFVSVRQGNTRQGRLTRFGLVWTGIMLLGLALGRGLSAWYLYAPLPGVGALLAGLLVGGRDGGSPLYQGPRALRTALGLGLLVTALLSSPLLIRSPEWEEVSRQTERWLSVVRQLPDSVFTQETLVAGIPVRVEFVPGQPARTRSAGCLMDFSLNSFARLIHGRESKLRVAAYARIVHPFARYSIIVSRRPREGTLRMQSFGPIRLEAATVRRHHELVSLGVDEMVIASVSAPMLRWDGGALRVVPEPSAWESNR